MELGLLGYGAMEESGGNESYGGDEIELLRRSLEKNDKNGGYAFSNPKPKLNMRFAS